MKEGGEEGRRTHLWAGYWIQVQAYIGEVIGMEHIGTGLGTRNLENVTCNLYWERDLGTHRRLGLATKNLDLERDEAGNGTRQRREKSTDKTTERTATNPLWSRVVWYACAELLTYDQPTVRWMELEAEGSRINSNIFNNSYPRESTPIRRLARFVGYQNMPEVKRMGGRTGPVHWAGMLVTVIIRLGDDRDFNIDVEAKTTQDYLHTVSNISRDWILDSDIYIYIYYFDSDSGGVPDRDRLKQISRALAWTERNGMGGMKHSSITRIRIRIRIAHIGDTGLNWTLYVLALKEIGTGARLRKEGRTRRIGIRIRTGIRFRFRRRGGISKNKNKNRKIGLTEGREADLNKTGAEDNL
ncbi:hypothetical protein B0H13DRAFT_1893066 [Mycena leptocephala]|nr:hypothetical protein B0H13DRAFT_1893066 [Mycena leptocephala]